MTIAFHKPYGVMTAFTDPQGRPTLAHYLRCPGLFPVGRLDQDSEGLLLLSDEPRVTRRVTAPGSHPKVYWVQLERVPGEEALQQFRQGVSILAGYRTRPAGIKLIEEPSLEPRPVPIRFRKNVATCWAEITLWEGKNRQVRRMTAAVGHPCLRLVRAAIGPIRLGQLGVGKSRPLNSAEQRWLATL